MMKINSRFTIPKHIIDILNNRNINYRTKKQTSTDTSCYNKTAGVFRLEDIAFLCNHGYP